MKDDNLLDVGHDTVPSASYLVSLRINHSAIDRLATHLSQLNLLLKDHAGFESIDIVRRDDGQGVEIFCILRFKCKDDLESWKLSSDGKAILNPTEALSVLDVTRQQACGSSIWFEPVVRLPIPPKPPRLWKRWLVSLVAVYPALIVLIYLLKPITSKVAEPIGLLLVATVLTGVTTALIAPWLSKRLHKWLISN
ncbi:hypothetical protein [Marinobacterium iners]|uniref:hypothetical protein n=1 Tax=Marinobacterium iners TaxID=48076 RepID=UPI001A8F0B0C|nr:hypothetical protein [Marinobacterium iners]